MNPVGRCEAVVQPVAPLAPLRVRLVVSRFVVSCRCRGQVLEFESRLWGALATLPAPASLAGKAPAQGEGEDDAQERAQKQGGQQSSGGTIGVRAASSPARASSLLDVLLLPSTPLPRVSGDVTAETLGADARAGKLSEHPVWAAVYAAARGVAASMAERDD